MRDGVFTAGSLTDGVFTVGVVTVGVEVAGGFGADTDGTFGVVTVGVVTVVVGVTGVLGTVTVVLGTVVVGTVVVTVGAVRPASAGTFTTPATMTEAVASDVSAAIRFRRPLPIGRSDTSTHRRINVQFDVKGAGEGAGRKTVAGALRGAARRAHEVAAPL